jgi:chaperonin GroEL
MNAVKNAATDGVLPGGGSALLHASFLLEGVEGDNLDETLGIKTLSKAIAEPFLALVDNTGLNSNFLASKVRETENWRFGVCLRSNKVKDLIDSGVK